MAGGETNDVAPANQRTYEVFQPPYFFRGPRPVITSAPAEVRLGRMFRVQTPAAASIARVRLVRPGAATHSFDQNQRMVDLQFTVDYNTNPPSLKAVAPSDMGVTPVGYYWLFICKNYQDNQGVVEVGAIPSMSVTVKLTTLQWTN